MFRKITLLSFLALIGFNFQSNGQGACPPNIDMEYGTTAFWSFFTGTCCSAGVIVATTPTPPVNGRHNITSGASTDYYGGFPVVSPGGGSYSMRLGYDTTGLRAERAVYNVHVPTGTVNYALVYQYAVVLQDPSGHSATQEPRFVVQAYDSATSAPIPCAAYSYVASAGLPGFLVSGLASRTAPTEATTIYYKDWTTATLNLTGLGGTTVTIDFEAGDCSLGGHFGYGYFDMSCGLFQVSGLTCDDTATTATLSAPSGFEYYTWYDSLTFTTVFGTTQTITIPIPGTRTVYAVVLSPYTGYGCPDTLYTTLSPSHLALHPTPDTLICSGTGAVITSGATDVATPLTYSWAPSSGLSCTGCANPTASPAGTTTYTVTVTNAVGCIKDTTITVRVGHVASSVSGSDVTCHGYNNGTATVTVTSGSPPFTYLWSSTPVQTTPTATGLIVAPALGPTSINVYSVTVTDAIGCTNVDVVTIHDGPITNLRIDSSHGPTKCNSNDGYIRLTGLIPGLSFTIDYLFNGVAQTQTLVGLLDSSVVLTGLRRGLYSNITVTANAPTNFCPYNVVGPLTLNDPPPPTVPAMTSNAPVCLGASMNLTALSTTGVLYFWTGPAGFNSVLQNPVIPGATYADSGVYVVTVVIDSCFSTDSIRTKVIPLPIPSAASNTPVCSGDTLFLMGSSSNGASSYTWNGPNSLYNYGQDIFVDHVTTPASGTYTVTVSLNGCFATATTVVVVNQTPEAPGVADTEYCQFSVVPPLTATDDAGNNLLWYTTPMGGTSSSIAPTPPTQVPGTTTWYVTQISTAGCESPRSPISVQVDYLATPTLTFTDSVICKGTEITFDALGTGDDMTGITWMFGEGDSIINQNPIPHSFDHIGTFTVTATAYYKVCPAKTVTTPVNIFPAPTVYLGADTSICPGGVPIILSDISNASNPAAKWSWSTGATESAIHVTTPGAYYVKVSINGCYTTDTINVANDCYMDLPNVFTPNGDGLNDYFFPRQLLTKGLTAFKMDIYNRWGQLVFTTSSLDGKGWDGKLNNAPQPEGVFVYIIDATFKDGQIEHHQGNVTLLR